jgi:hemolysin III
MSPDELPQLPEPVSTWSHCAGLLLALPGTAILWRRGAGDATKRLSLLVYGLTLAFCYSASSLFHGVRLPAAGIAALARLDGVGIFALIAGSYTPLAWCLMRGRWRRWTLTIVWGVAATATAWIATGRHFSPAWSTGLYLGMGWGVLACYSEIAAVVSHRALLPIVVGGLSYSLGAVLNLLRWPVLYPGIFGAHELFHLFVLAGSLAHYRFILKVVVPFAPAAEVVSLRPIPGVASCAHDVHAPRDTGPSRPWGDHQTSGLLPPRLAEGHRLAEGEHDDFLAGDGADVVVHGQDIHAGDVLDHRL